MHSCLQGDTSTKEYRMFVTEEGKDVSPWHDVVLRNDDGEAMQLKSMLAGTPCWLCAPE